MVTTRITPEELHQCHRWIRLDEVRRLPGNPNRGHAPSLAASVDTFGWVDGLVVHRGVILAGNHRFDLALAQGLEGLPGYDLSKFDLSAAEVMARALAHNHTTRAGVDDPELLAAALGTVGPVGAALHLPPVPTLPPAGGPGDTGPKCPRCGGAPK